MSNIWQKLETKNRETPKFPTKGVPTIFYPIPEPVEDEIEGQYGKQHIYIVLSDVGLMYLNDKQFLKVCSAFKGDFTQSVTVTI